MTGLGQPYDRSFDDAYIGVPPWDIGRPQRVVSRSPTAGAFSAPVVDAGCGTGENALALVARGLEVLGLDASPRAIGKAMDKARDRDLRGADFLVADAFGIGGLGRSFGSALDCGFFHVLDDHERPVYAAALHEALAPEGSCTCSASATPSPRVGSASGERGGAPEPPSRIDGMIRELVASSFETNLELGEVKAWRAAIVRT